MNASYIHRTRNGGFRLAVPPSAPEHQPWVYGLGLPFQVGPTEVAMFCNIRLDGTPVDDMEAGSDLIRFDQLDDPRAWHVMPLNRSEIGSDPRNGQPLHLVKYAFSGGFIPLGARRDDGSPHSHAGTGFGLSIVVGFPADNSVTWVGQMKNPLWYFEFAQFTYDGGQLRVTDCRRVECEQLLPGWKLTEGPLGMAISDGDELLCGMTGSNGTGPGGAGMARWRREGGAWRPVDFQLVTGNDASHEPSLIRDTDGSLLFCARGCYSYRVPPGCADHSQSIRVWRSADHGAHWKQVIHEAGARSPTPVTLNCALDGTPYVAFNPLRWTGEKPQNPGAAREFMERRRLSVDRRSLLPASLVRDAPSDFGPAPNHSRWCVDHPIGATVRLRDGRLHHLLSYRVLDIAESRGAPPTPFTGCYVEEFPEEH